MFSMWARLVAALSCGAPGTRPAAAQASVGKTWIAFYGQTADTSELSQYNIVVLDPMFQGSIAEIAGKGATVCSYLSLGEVRLDAAYGADVAPDALLEENPNWPGTRRIDVRQASWSRLVLDELIPQVAAKGFNGLLLDTLETPHHLEQLDPEKNAGMSQSAAKLVREIRSRYPKMMLIINRGYGLLADVGDCVDAVVAESLLTTVDCREDRFDYRWNSAQEVGWQLALLQPVLNRPDPVPILSLDYWNPEDTEGVREIYRRQRSLHHYPYVGQRLLDTIVPEPGRQETQ
ncbi:MAG TPA: endo alpha-1,4 polygalactosaminidase [Acetobacteraceae bacterium]|nr:endo alpha-1,4 polygalactosaminidase [Acetobacteraceae bacterium]